AELVRRADGPAVAHGDQGGFAVAAAEAGDVLDVDLFERGDGEGGAAGGVCEGGGDAHAQGPAGAAQEAGGLGVLKVGPPQDDDLGAALVVIGLGAAVPAVHALGRGEEAVQKVAQAGEGELHDLDAVLGVGGRDSLGEEGVEVFGAGVDQGAVEDGTHGFRLSRSNSCRPMAATASLTSSRWRLPVTVTVAVLSSRRQQPATLTESSSPTTTMPSAQKGHQKSRTRRRPGRRCWPTQPMRPLSL